MILKGILFLILLTLGIYTGLRFGIFLPNRSSLPRNTINNNIPTVSPSTIPPSLTAKPKQSTSSANITLLTARATAAASQKFTISWYVHHDTIATISHTAIHYGKISKPNASLPSDYPEKSIILKGTIPATFSAQLTLPLAGTYFYRAHAIVDTINVWSDEKVIDIKAATIGAQAAF